MASIRWLLPICLMAVFISFCQGSQAASSLWLSGRDLYSTHGGRDFKPGDIITVNIAEQATAKQQATSDTTDNSLIEIKSAPSIPFFKRLMKNFIGKNEIKNTWGGNGTTTRSGSLAGTVSATVLEVLPNGNLLIEGSRTIRVNRENQNLRVRGVARPQDIDSANVIDSKLLADADIKFEGKGTVGNVNKPGIMTRITSWVF